MSTEWMEKIIENAGEWIPPWRFEARRLMANDDEDMLSLWRWMSFFVEWIGNKEWTLFMKMQREYPYYFSDLTLFEKWNERVDLEEFVSLLKTNFPSENILFHDMRKTFWNAYIQSDSFFCYLTQTNRMYSYTISIFFKEIWDVSVSMNSFLQPYVKTIRANVADIAYFFEDKGNVNKKSVLRSASDYEYVYEGLYPGIDVKELVSDFLKSDENILILTWEAWVGKTTMIKYMMRCMMQARSEKVNIAYCKDEKLVKADKFWVDLSSEYSWFNMLILDDFDYWLSPRVEKSEENSFVSKLLSFSDWIFDNNIKVVITTNRDIEAIDSALVRPGRCFDILRLRALKRDEALAVWKHEWLDEDDFDRIYSQDIEKISQAEISSEMKALKSNSPKLYIKEEWLSVRKAFESWNVRRKVGFWID